MGRRLGEQRQVLRPVWLLVQERGGEIGWKPLACQPCTGVPQSLGVLYFVPPEGLCACLSLQAEFSNWL